MLNEEALSPMLCSPRSAVRPVLSLLLGLLLIAAIPGVGRAASKNTKEEHSASEDKAYHPSTPVAVGLNFSPSPSIAESLTSPSLPLFVWPADNPALVSHYRGGTTPRVVARCAQGELTEQDLYLYLVLNRDPQPDLFQRYQQATTAQEREILQHKLEAAIRDWATDMYFASLPEIPRNGAGRAFDKLRLRLTLYPVYKLLWTDRYVRPMVVIAQEDINKYYQDHQKQFLPPLTVHVQALFLRANTENRAAVREQMDRIYNAVLVGDADGSLTFDDAVRRWSQAPNAAQGGDIPEFSAGNGPSKELEDNAFEVKEGQFRIFETADGIYLIKGLTPTPRQVRPLKEVSAQIHQELFMNFLQRLYIEETRSLPGNIAPLTLIQMANFFEPHPSSLRLGNFSLTEDAILELFPSLVLPTFKVDLERMNKALAGLLMDEYIARESEEHAYDSDILMLRAVQLAKTIRIGRENIRTQLLPSLILSRQQIMEYLHAHANSTLASEFAPYLSSVQVSLRTPKEIGVANRQEHIDFLKTQLLRAQATFTTQTLEQTLTAQLPTQGNPFTVVAKSIQETLLRNQAAGKIATVDIWDQSQPLIKLPADALPTIRQIQENLTSKTLTLPRFPSLTETSTTLILPIVETPDYSMPHVAAMRIDDWRRKVTAAIEIEKRAELEERTAKEQKLEILLP
jgi:hypothetical protein